MSEIICPQCKATLNEGASFCHVCGYKMPDEIKQPQETAEDKNVDEKEIQQPQDTAEDKKIDVKDFTDVKPDEVFAAIKSGNIFKRAINIMFKPKSEWAVVANEKPNVPMLIFGYSLILAIIPVISLIIGNGLVGRRVYVIFSSVWNRSFGLGFGEAFIFILAAFTAIIVGAVIINELAPTFKTEKNFGRAMQLTTYSFTPVFIAGALFILPFLSFMAHLAGLYGIFVLLIGLPIIMKTPKENQVGYFFTSIGILFGIFWTVKWTFSAILMMFIRTSYHIPIHF